MFHNKEKNYTCPSQLIRCILAGVGSVYFFSLTVLHPVGGDFTFAFASTNANNNNNKGNNNKNPRLQFKECRIIQA